MREHLETFLAEVQARTGTGLPAFVREEFEAFLQCGILAHGFLRVRCADCAHEKRVAFSCKRRGFSPSCGARRMAQSAAVLVDEVIPRVPVRQWVLSFPIGLRVLFAVRPELHKLRVDGSVADKDLLMQFQADILGVPVVRPKVLETTALSAAYLVDLYTDVWKLPKEIAAQCQMNRRFKLQIPSDEAKKFSRASARQ